MAVLSQAQRLALSRKLQRQLPRVFNEQLAALSEADFLAAIAGIDDWRDANAVAFNQSIPQPARGILSTRCKTIIFQAIIDEAKGA